MSDWRPIRTAPEDRFIQLGKWGDSGWEVSHGKVRKPGWFPSLIISQALLNYQEFTHWRPYPEPPR